MLNLTAFSGVVLSLSYALGSRVNAGRIFFLGGLLWGNKNTFTLGLVVPLCCTYIRMYLTIQMVHDAIDD